MTNIEFHVAKKAEKIGLKVSREDHPKTDGTWEVTRNGKILVHFNRSDDTLVWLNGYERALDLLVANFMEESF